MSGRASTIFKQYTDPEAQPSDADASEAPPSYQAFTVEVRRGVSRLRIHDQEGTVMVLPYAYLVEVMCSSHQYLSLIFTHCVLTLEGRHLDQLIEPLQDEKIRALHCFLAKEHELPGEGVSVIKRIARQHPSEFLGGNGRKEGK